MACVLKFQRICKVGHDDADGKEQRKGTRFKQLNALGFAKPPAETRVVVAMSGGGLIGYSCLIT